MPSTSSSFVRLWCHSTIARQGDKERGDTETRYQHFSLSPCLPVSLSFRRSFVDEAAAFAFEARERHGRDAADFDLEAELQLQLLGDSRRLLQVVFDFDDELVHRAVLAGREAIFDDFGKAVQDLLDRRRDKRSCRG